MSTLLHYLLPVNCNVEIQKGIWSVHMQLDFVLDFVII